MPNHPNFYVTAFAGVLENTEFEFSSLYLHHFVYGPSPTQSSIISANSTTGWGSTEVNNWPIYDRVGTDAKLVARAQGLHIYAGNWHNMLTIVFEIERFVSTCKCMLLHKFKQSTLQIMGTSVEQEGQWSIVGGTGELAMARGVINKKLHHRTNEGDIIELTIHGFCRVQIPTLGKSGPWGGNGGSVVDSENPSRIESITILYKGIVASFEYSYIDYYGNRRTTGPWGSKNPNRTEIVLGPGEILTAVSGTVIKHNTPMETKVDVVQTLKFVTTKKTYGPYGNLDNNKELGTPFSAVAPDGKAIVGFFGRTDGRYVNAIGVYIA
ncbi:hypothetical protein VPH35_133452 [Triticum aestivum]